MIHGHGDDLFNFESIHANFSSNVYQHENIHLLFEYLKTELNPEMLGRYPEPNASSLAKAIAKTVSIYDTNILVTNGATEAIYLIAQTFQKRKTAILIPTFSEYEDASKIHHHELHFIQSLDEITESHYDLVWICNPNNPTGTLHDKQRLLNLFEAHPKTTFVIDHSYAHFICDEDLLLEISEVSNCKNAIMIHSMTKHFSIPSLRLGYITANSELINAISHYKMPWSVNQIAILAGEYLMEHAHAFKLPLKELHQRTLDLQNRIDAIEGFKSLPTDTHFFLVKLEKEKGSSKALKTYLAEHGILIRDAANFRGLDESYFRLATQSDEKNRSLIDLLISCHSFL